jgi:hypothetical protein
MVLVRCRGARAILGWERGACIRPLRTAAAREVMQSPGLRRQELRKHVGAMEARRLPMNAGGVDDGGGGGVQMDEVHLSDASSASRMTPYRHWTYRGMRANSQRCRQ